MQDDELTAFSLATLQRNAKGTATANSAMTGIVQPLVRITNHWRTLTILSIRFTSATVYVRFRICDDSYENLTVLERDSRPGVTPQTRRFTTTRGAETRRCLYAPLAARAPLPWTRQVHRHAPRNR